MQQQKKCSHLFLLERPKALTQRCVCVLLCAHSRTFTDAEGGQERRYREWGGGYGVEGHAVMEEGWGGAKSHWLLGLQW